MFISFQEDWSETQKLIEVMRYCSALLKYQPQIVSDVYWDFVVILLGSWTGNLNKLELNIENSTVSTPFFYTNTLKIKETPKISYITI